MAGGFVFSLEKLVIHEVAKACWGEYVLVSLFEDSDTDIYLLMDLAMRAMKVHRETTVKRISEMCSSTLPRLLEGELVDAVIHLERGYREALICSERLRYKYRVMTMNPLTTGQYSAKKFIDPRGYFDELAWAKRVVADETRSALSRFELACVYCLEESIRNFWFSEISGGSHPYEGHYRDIRENVNVFVALWVCALDNRVRQVVEEEDDIADGFYEYAFGQSMEVHNEYAARFFWARISADYREALIRELNTYFENNEMWHKLYYASIDGYGGFVYFFYTLLSAENKKKHLSTTSIYMHVEEYAMSVCLLLSRYYESVLNDIMSFFPTNSCGMYAYILWSLASEMKQLPVVEYKTVFRTLWRSLSREQREEILFRSFPIIIVLIGVRDMGLLRIVIRSMSPAKKEDMLVRNQGGGGTSALNELSEFGDYDAMHQYLLFFFIDLDPETRVLRLRDDAIDLFYRFVNESNFLGWVVGIEQSRRIRVLQVMDSLNESLHVMQNLLDRAEETNRA